MRFFIAFLLIVFPCSSFATVCQVAPPLCTSSTALNATCRAYINGNTSNPIDVKLTGYQYNFSCNTGSSQSCFSAAEIVPIYSSPLVSLFQACNGTSECGGDNEGNKDSLYVDTASITCPPVTCTSFTYSAWGACNNGTQTRTVLTSSPAGCTGGSPVLSQSCEPANCTDNSKSGNETGVDCGGSCLAACQKNCPSGYTYVTEIDECLREVEPVQGNCPSGFAIHVAGGKCQNYVSSFSSSPTDPPPPGTWTGLPLGWRDAPVISFTAATSTNTVTNADGTKTATTTSSVSASSSDTGSGSVSRGGSTTTVVKTYNPTTGEVLSETKTEQVQQDPADDPRNFSSGAPVLDSAADFSPVSARLTTFTNNIKNAPIYAPLNAVLNPTLGAGTGSYSVAMGSYGTTNINLADYSSAWSVIRYALIFSSLFMAAKIVIINRG